jgi:hypothetical protein
VLQGVSRTSTEKSVIVQNKDSREGRSRFYSGAGIRGIRSNFKLIPEGFSNSRVLEQYNEKGATNTHFSHELTTATPRKQATHSSLSSTLIQSCFRADRTYQGSLPRTVRYGRHYPSLTRRLTWRPGGCIRLRRDRTPRTAVKLWEKHVQPGRLL